MLRLTLFLTLTCCAAIEAAQHVTVREKRPNGDIIIEIEGVEYRAVSADNWRQVLTGRAELDAMKRRLAIVENERDLWRQKFEMLGPRFAEEVTLRRQALDECRQRPGLLRRLWGALF